MTATVGCCVALSLAAPAMADGPYEPNNSPATASGPLLGGFDYHAAIESKDDVDVYAMYLTGARQIAVSFIETGGPGCSTNYDNYRINAHVENERGSFVASATRVRPNLSTVNFTTVAAGKFLVVLEASPNFMRESCGYSFRVDPADAVLPAQPAPAPPNAPALSPTPDPAPSPDTSPAIRTHRGFSIGTRMRHGRRYPSSFYIRFMWNKDIKWQRTTLFHRGRVVKTNTWSSIPPIAGKPYRTRLATDAKFRAAHTRARRQGRLVTVVVRVQAIDMHGNQISARYKKRFYPLG